VRPGSPLQAPLLSVRPGPPGVPRAPETRIQPGGGCAGVLSIVGARTLPRVFGRLMLDDRGFSLALRDRAVSQFPIGTTLQVRHRWQRTVWTTNRQNRAQGLFRGNSNCATDLVSHHYLLIEGPSEVALLWSAFRSMPTGWVTSTLWDVAAELARRLTYFRADRMADGRPRRPRQVPGPPHLAEFSVGCTKYFHGVTGPASARAIRLAGRTRGEAAATERG